MTMPDLSILVPIYNERATIARALEAITQAELPVASREIVLLDDGSTDGTREWLQERSLGPEVRLVLHPRNLGKGAAIRTAVDHARGTYATIMDADLEYDPQSIGPLLRPLLEGDAQVVYGVRGFEAHSAFSFWYVMGNKFVSTATNVLFNTWLSDIMTCHKVLPTSLFRVLALREGGFAFEAEITARLVASGVRIYEVPVTYRARSREAGKKLTAIDGLRVIKTLVRCRLDRRRVQGVDALVPPPVELSEELRARFQRAEAARR
jgi:dolichol-phosphate hexosyltransferase